MDGIWIEQEHRWWFSCLTQGHITVTCDVSWHFYILCKVGGRKENQRKFPDFAAVLLSDPIYFGWDFLNCNTFSSSFYADLFCPWYTTVTFIATFLMAMLLRNHIKSSCKLFTLSQIHSTHTHITLSHLVNAREAFSLFTFDYSGSVTECGQTLSKEYLYSFFNRIIFSLDALLNHFHSLRQAKTDQNIHSFSVFKL